MNTIYKITNKINGKIYIGQTWGSLNQRFNEHKRKTGRASLVGLAVKKYGKDSFTIEAVCYAVDQADADYWECHFIRRFDSIKTGYNIKEGGSRGRCAESTKQKLSAINMGKTMSPELSARCIANGFGAKGINKGMTRSDEMKKTISQKNSKCPLTADQMETIRADDNGNYSVLALKYGCTYNLVRRLKTRPYKWEV